MATTSQQTTQTTPASAKSPEQTPEAQAETHNPLRTVIAPTDFSQYPHTTYAQPNEAGEVEMTTIRVGSVEIEAPARVTCPPKFAPELKAVEKYVPPFQRQDSES